jgi:hypothetical protein
MTWQVAWNQINNQVSCRHIIGWYRLAYPVQ